MSLHIETTFNGSIFQINNSKISFIGFISFFLDSFLIDNSIINYVANNSILIIYASTFVFSENSTIMSSLISIASPYAFQIDGQIISQTTSCSYEDTSQTPSKFFNFMIENSKISIFESFYAWSQNSTEPTYKTIIYFFSDLLFKNYTVLLVSEDIITIDGNSRIIGSEIGIFADSLDVYDAALIDSTGMGCEPFEGPGKGSKIFNAQYECGGNGGSYGGFQGYGFGGDLYKSELCKQFAADFSIKYGDPFYPKYQGSGGGGLDAGYGGGIIMINLVNELSLFDSGSIKSEGGSLTADKCNSVKGSGAGSGGSIQIYAKRIYGEGVISADGGDSYNYCGEGGGGRVLVHFYGWENDFNIQSALAWKGNITANCGKRIIDMDNFEYLRSKSFFGTEGSKQNFN